MRGLRYYWVPPLCKFFMNANYGCLHTENLDCSGRNQGGKRAQAPTQHFNFFLFSISIYNNIIFLF